MKISTLFRALRAARTWTVTEIKYQCLRVDYIREYRKELKRREALHKGALRNPRRRRPLP